MIIFDYIYFQYYRHFKYLSNEMPDFIAMIALCWLIFLNVYSLIAVYVILMDLNVIDVFSNQKLGLVIVGLILSSNYYRYSYNQKFKLIVSKFETNPKLNLNIGALIVFIFTIVSFSITLIYVVPFISNHGI
jgi:hypothetical protein